MRGKTNEPSFVAHTARLLAEVKGIEPAELARATTATMLTLFDRIPPAECGTFVAGFPA
jgi:TatD DNase family protein